MPEPQGERLEPESYRDLVRRALAEDIGAGDVTTAAIVPAERRARATLQAKSTCVLAGLHVAREVCAQVDGRIQWVGGKHDGDLCQSGDVIAVLRGPAAALLKAERTLLNFVQHLSGIATLTRRFVYAADGGITILDTRKTLPTFRALAKYAVRCGGATNHRFGLFDGILIKDNHIRIAGSIAVAVSRVREALVAQGHTDWRVEVEAQTLDQVDQALAAGAEIIMLDNLGIDEMREAIRVIGGRARVEVSGGVSLDHIASLATLGADCVSVGALTHSAPAADISLEIESP